MGDVIIHTSKPRAGDKDRDCCMGAAMRDRCTCWRLEHDRPQEPPADEEAQPEVRDSCCDDCACRPGSPENEGDPRVLAYNVRKLAESGDKFFCHKGMRKPVRRVHPDGEVVELDNQHRYDPPRREDGVPLKADGTPADLCAGWAAMIDDEGGSTDE